MTDDWADVLRALLEAGARPDARTRVDLEALGEEA